MVVSTVALWTDVKGALLPGIILNILLYEHMMMMDYVYILLIEYNHSTINYYY